MPLIDGMPIPNPLHTDPPLAIPIKFGNLESAPNFQCSSKSNDDKLIMYIVIGGGGGLLLFGAAILFYCCRKNRNNLEHMPLVDHHTDA